MTYLEYLATIIQTLYDNKSINKWVRKYHTNRHLFMLKKHDKDNYTFYHKTLQINKVWQTSKTEVIFKRGKVWKIF